MTTPTLERPLQEDAIPSVPQETLSVPMPKDRANKIAGIGHSLVARFRSSPAAGYDSSPASAGVATGQSANATPGSPGATEADSSQLNLEAHPYYAEITANPILKEVTPDRRQEAIKNTLELYDTAKEYVAPVIAGFADELLHEADSRQIIFAARDGLGAFQAAKILKDKFDYGNDDPDQLMYAYLTRKIVWNTPPNDLARYFKETGVRDFDDSVLLADIGMYGSIVPHIQQTIPNIEPHFLITKTPSIPGYAHNADHPMSSLGSIAGNPAVHFMEDTFSGAIASPHRLVEKDGKLVPDTFDVGFPPEEALKREFALKAIQDYTSGLTEPPQQPQAAIEKLDTLLGEPSKFKALMVPHTK